MLKRKWWAENWQLNTTGNVFIRWREVQGGDWFLVLYQLDILYMLIIIIVPRIFDFWLNRKRKKKSSKFISRTQCVGEQTNIYSSAFLGGEGTATFWTKLMALLEKYSQIRIPVGFPHTAKRCSHLLSRACHVQLCLRPGQPLPRSEWQPFFMLLKAHKCHCN